jgi:DNA ligase (NAD+)
LTKPARAALAQRYGTWDAFAKGLAAAASGAPGDDYLHLAAVDGVGPVAAQSLARFFAEDHNRAKVANLVAELHIQPVAKPKTDTAVAGKTIVFTGALEKMTRDEAKAQAEGARGKGRLVGVEEDRPRRRRTRRGLQAEDRQRAWHPGHDRGRVAGDGRTQ